MDQRIPLQFPPNSLSAEVSLSETSLLDKTALSDYGGFTADAPVLVVLAAGKGTRFGTAPKCIQPVMGKPLARHTIDAFRQVTTSPAICIVGYRYEEVANALGDDNIYIRSQNPTGGTALATYEALSAPHLLDVNPLLIVTMGDRIVPAAIYRQLWKTHRNGGTGLASGNSQSVPKKVGNERLGVSAAEAHLTLLTAEYDPLRNQGKGRILRDESGVIVGIREQKDIEAEPDFAIRQQQLDLTEGNCPLYMIRAKTLYAYLSGLTKNNAQQQFYITDIIANIAKDGGLVRSITTSSSEPAYQLLCADVTHAEDLPRLEKLVSNIAP